MINHDCRSAGVDILLNMTRGQAKGTERNTDRKPYRAMGLYVINALLTILS